MKKVSTLRRSREKNTANAAAKGKDVGKICVFNLSRCEESGARGSRLSLMEKAKVVECIKARAA